MRALKLGITAAAPSLSRGIGEIRMH